MHEAGPKQPRTKRKNRQLLSNSRKGALGNTG